MSDVLRRNNRRADTAPSSAAVLESSGPAPGTAAADMTVAGVKPAPVRDRRVIVIDDEEIMLDSCRRILRRAGYQVEVFTRGAEGIQRIRETHAPVLIVDLKMPDLDGFEVLEQVKAMDGDVVIVVITGYATVATAVDAMKAGAYDFLPKPFTPDELRLIVGRGLERWRLRQEARRHLAEKEANRRRFVSFVSHQLKSPLVAVRQYMDVLATTVWRDIPDEARRWIARSRERLEEMLQIIQEWLALARIESGDIVDLKSRTAVEPVIRQVLEEHKLLARTRCVALQLDFPAAVPAIRGDELSLRTVISNLVHNAIQYSYRGGKVTVGARCDEADVQIQVRDTGIGVPADKQSVIFDDFVRLPYPGRENITGSGLGLTICRTLVQQLEGSIEVESRERQGSLFTVRLPLAGAPSPDGEAS